jgi:hypothetical protein
MIRFHGNTGGGTNDGPNVVNIDDIYLLDDSTRLGRCRVSTLLPNADTADTDWMPLAAGSHFAEVDDDNGDTSYIASDTATDLDMFDAQDLPYTPQTVHAVQISWRARKDDAATREVRSRIRSDPATADGATRTLTSSYLYYHDVFRGRPCCRRAVDRGRRSRCRDRRRDGDLRWPRAASPRSLPRSRAPAASPTRG